MDQRRTRSKLLVSQLLQAYARPLSLREIYSLAQPTTPNLAYSTVYRIIQQLIKQEKVRQVDWRERGSRFEWADLPHHHHLVCKICTKIIDIADADLGFNEAAIEQRTGFVIRHHSIELEGICPACQEKTKGVLTKK